MPAIPIISNRISFGPCTATSRLPRFYMEDYSLIGFRVNPYGASLSILRDHGYRVEVGNPFARIILDHFQQIPDVMRLLTTHDIRCRFADLAVELYQG